MLTGRMNAAESTAQSRSYLDTLNAEQRAAVEFGIGDSSAGPLASAGGDRRPRRAAAAPPSSIPLRRSIRAGLVAPRASGGCPAQGSLPATRRWLALAPGGRSRAILSHTPPPPCRLSARVFARSCSQCSWTGGTDHHVSSGSVRRHAHIASDGLIQPRERLCLNRYAATAGRQLFSAAGHARLCIARQKNRLPPSSAALRAWGLRRDRPSAP
jgi:hypothetical protein